MEMDQDMKEIKQTPQNDHANVLAKIKKAISAAMMAGMLASPLAAKDMKNANTYKEPTRVERSAEQVSADQAVYNDAVKLFEDIINSDLINTIKDLTPREVVLTAPAVSNEVTDYITRLAGVVEELNSCYKNQKIIPLREIRSAIKSGKIKELPSPFMYMQALATKHLESDFGIDPSVASVAFQEEFRGIDGSIKTSVSKDNGIWGNLFAVKNHPEQKALCMAYLHNNVQNLSDLMPDACGSESARKAYIWMSLSTCEIHDMIIDLGKAGYKFNENNLKPQKNIQQQADLGMER